MNVLIKSAKIVDAASKGLHLKKRDILIKNGKIVEIAAKIKTKGNVKVFQQKNLHVSKGWFDSGVSFGEPGYEERETIFNGLQTAAKSGFTDVVLNPNTNPVPDTSSDIVFLKNAAQNQATNVHPLGTVTAKGKGVDLAELYDMNNSGAVGFYDFKRPIENPNLLKIALQYAQNFDALVYSFPLDKYIAGKGIVNEGSISTSLGLKGIPALAEELHIARDIFILEYTGGKLHIPTVSTHGAVQLIAEAKKRGLDISCSVALHNLSHTDTELETFDAQYKVMPPLRAKKDTDALIKGLKAGTIDFVTSDHLPINIELKEVEFDNAAFGTLGLETAFGILRQFVDTGKAIELLTKGRDRFGIDNHAIKEGAQACLTLFDPDLEYTFATEHILSTSKNSMFMGQTLTGKAVGIVNNNQFVHH